MKVFTTILLSLAIAIGCTGCFAVLVGAGAAGGTIAYVHGEMKATESAPIRKVWSATEVAVKELGLAVMENRHDELSGKLVARSSSDQKIEINVVSLGSNSSEIRIRVGVFGDQNFSRLILQKIQSHL